MFKNVFKSLTFKISSFIIIIMMVSLSVFSLVLIFSERTKMLNDIVKNGQTFATFSSNSIYDNYVQLYTHTGTDNFTSFQTNVQAILDNNKDVINVSLLGINGKILFSSDEFKNGKYGGSGRSITDEKTLSILASDKVSTRNIIENGQEVTEIIVPLSQAGGGVFYMRYVLSNASLSSRMSEIYLQIFSVVIPLIMFAVVLAILFTIQIVRPVRTLITTVEKIKGGNFDIKADANSKDEIGRLAFAFNDMTSKLKDSYGFLEAKVKDRTAELGAKVAELAENNAELGDSKRAITNLLEDIEIEKSKVEETVKIRTKELSEEKSRLLASINSLSFGFIIAGMDGSVILSNPSILKILNIEKYPSTIADIAKLFEGFDLINSCKECLATQKTVEIKEIIFATKFLRVFCAPIVNINEVIGHVIIIEDITEAKVMERSKDEFFAVASHELRTPLTAIHGNADMILDMYLDKIPDKDVKEMIVDINSASIRLINIVNDFLQVSRLEQGKIETKKEVFELPTIISKVVKDLKVVADKRNISITYNMPVITLPKILADQNHTEQVLINLIGNAIKFTDGGGVVVTTTVNNNFIEVRIIDSGLGIETKNQSLLFRKFQQAGSSFISRKDTNSTGLGLYISKLLVSSMGGSIALEKSAPGAGSTFVFTLPIVV